MKEQKYELGMIGLGVMGRNFTLNVAEHGYRVVGYDTDINKVNALRAEDTSGNARGAANIKEFIGLLKAPRAVMMLVPAGAPVDAVIRSLLPYLEPGDVIIDGGNSHYKDTDLRL